jgi:TonB family protein
MTVSEIIRDRMEEPAGLRGMAVLSILVHAAALAVLALAPADWLSQVRSEPRTVMTISLGGAGTSGPRTGGMTAIGGRPVQAETPPEATRRPEPVRPPAARTPEMTLPRPDARPARRPATPVRQAPPEARGTTPTRGDRTRAGTAIAETGARGQGFGLSTGGGAGSGSRLDVANFCCPDYLALMLERIRANWQAQAEVAGNAVIVFTIERNGRITDVSVESPSPIAMHNLNAQRALLLTRQLPPLPDAFTNPRLTVHLNFEYTR